ncbi:hypothetical protein MLD38_003520 [Melastoma candidum]|uniref:Uncharacterized protein n=1 Tax=Melastoma candidum TaxID=119954 RepID=A0ACB9S230_9MYRT|nr:hypothetical protein MLD38_003520 [Melastoma candidum]
MDLAASCKEKLAYFRIKELKDVLTQLGLSKQGRKQDLVERILSTLRVPDDPASKLWNKKTAGKDDVEKLVDDIYRKMQVTGATDLASIGPGSSDCSNVKVKGEYDDPFHSETKVRCPCGTTLETDSMIRCEDPRCNVWQHITCVVVPEKPMDGIPPIPERFYCELCRLSRADPFWVSVAHPLNPVKMARTNIPTDGTNPMLSIDRNFQLTRADKDLLSKQEYDIQAWCMLLNDKVPFRIQWPQYADLQINGLAVRAINRPGSQLLGANGRDDGPIITPCTKDGINKISVTGCDARVFCVGVRIVKRRTLQQILNLIPKETEGERFEDALARVCRCVGGGGTTEADSDSDIEVVAESFGVNLRCPMSGSRMKVAGRFRSCVHMGCFDLEVFVEMNRRSRKWQCPICLKNYSLESIIIDPYFNRITSLMRHCGEDVTEIEVKPDGSWRAKTKTETERRELGDLVQWHLPDSTLVSSTVEKPPPKVDQPKPIKQEGVSDGHTCLKLGIKKNRDGIWEVSKPEDPNSYPGNRFHDNFGDQEPKVIPMSSSASGSGRDGEDPSVNQDGLGNFDFSVHNGIELDSTPVNGDHVLGFTDENPSALVDAEIIVLSDSDDENDLLVSSGDMYRNNGQSEPSGINFSIPQHGIADSFEDPTLGTGGNACLGLFNPSDDDFGEMPLWLPTGPQAGPGFQLFSADVDVSDALADMQHGPITCPPAMNGYSLAPENTIDTTALAPDIPLIPRDINMSENLVNPSAIGRDDPSLQIFLPTRPSSNASAPYDSREHAEMSNGLREDWISLRLGGDVTSGPLETPNANGFNHGQQIPSVEGSMDSLDTASLLLGMNDNRSEKANKQRYDDPFSFPRQKRSVRPRLYLSINDSDTE